MPTGSGQTVMLRQPDLRMLLAEAVAARATAKQERDDLREQLSQQQKQVEFWRGLAQREQTKLAAKDSRRNSAEAASLEAELARTQQRARAGEVSRLCLDGEKRRRQDLEAALQVQTLQVEALRQRLEEEQQRSEQAIATADELRQRRCAASEAVADVASAARARAEAALAATACAIDEQFRLKQLAAVETQLREERQARAAAEEALVQAQAEIVDVKLLRDQAEYEHAERAGTLYSKVRSKESSMASSWGSSMSRSRSRSTGRGSSRT